MRASWWPRCRSTVSIRFSPPNGVQSANLAMKNVANYLASVLPPGAALARLGEYTFLFMTPRSIGRSIARLEADTYDAVNGIHRAARLPPEVSIISGIAIANRPRQPSNCCSRPALR